MCCGEAQGRYHTEEILNFKNLPCFFIAYSTLSPNLSILLLTGIHLQTSSGEIWSPVLVIEPSGGANASFPRRQLFTRLKHEFFRHAHRIQVQFNPLLFPDATLLS
jgi:hypothetical protein